jgi:hypothetical protein
MTRSRLVLAVALISLCTPVAAHKINPLANKYHQHQDGSVWERVAEPVHEEITLRARACADEANGPVQTPLVCTTADAPAGNPDGNKYDSLIRGVWWNDDPNQLLFAGYQAKWLAWMNDGEKIAKHGVNYLGKPATITADYYMTYRSHFGDLQFLHAMASKDGEDPATTQNNILSWAEFAYSVATRAIDASTTLDHVQTPGFQNYFAKQPGWSVRYLLGPRYLLTHPDHFQQMALGSLLHMVQDSYSAAHTERAFDASPRCPNGRVHEFYSYVGQDPDKHGTADTRAGWQERQFTAAQDPVNVSATLIRFARQRTAWPVVRSYLQETVFCVDADAQVSSAGPFASAP